MLTKENNEHRLYRRDYVLGAFSVLAGILLVAFGVFGGFNLGFTISNLVIIIIGSCFLKKKENKLGAFGFLLLLLSSLGSFVFGRVADYTVNFILFFLLFIAEAAYFRILSQGTNSLGDLKLPLMAVFTVVMPTFDYVAGASALLFSRIFGNFKQCKKVLIGGLLSLPVLFVVIPLLVHSDAAFEGLIENIGSNFLLWILKIALGLIIAPFIYTYFFANRYFGYQYKINKKIRPITDPVYGASFLGVISACYCLYLFSQLAYIFGGLGGILPEDFTMAEYARRGFFEIAIISFINFSLVYGVLVLCKRTKKTKLLTAIMMFFCAFTMFLIVTAEAKMFMYISRFGITPLRIYTSVFLAFLFIMGIVMALRCFSKRIYIIRSALIIALTLLISLGALGAGRMVATYNADMYISGNLKTLDLETISNCGYSSIESLVKLERHIAKEYSNPENSAAALMDYDIVYNDIVDELIDKFFENYNFDIDGNVIRKQKSTLENFVFEKHLALNFFDEYMKQDPEFVHKAIWRESDLNPFDEFNREYYLTYRDMVLDGREEPVRASVIE